MSALLIPYTTTVSRSNSRPTIAMIRQCIMLKDYAVLMIELIDPR